MKDVSSDTKIKLVVVQPTPFCNLDCTYCYLPSRHVKTKMSVSVVKSVFQKIFDSGWTGKDLSVVWHAGEPLVLPPSYYRRVFEAISDISPAGLKIRHNFQTNATIVSDEILELIREFDVRIGVSVDGPKHIHDKYRIDRTGKGTFTRTIKGIRQLVNAGIDVHTISVLTDYSLDYPDEMFNFFVTEGLTRVGFNIEEIEGINTKSSLQKEKIYERCWRFMSRFWSLTINTGKINFLRELDQAISSIIRPEGKVMRNSLTEPFAILNVDVEGNFSTFSPELLGFQHPTYGSFCFGNLTKDTLESALSNDKFLALKSDIDEGVKKCRDTCQYFSVCGGGAPANKLWEKGSFKETETLYCILTKQQPIDLALQMIKNISFQT